MENEQTSFDGLPEPIVRGLEVVAEMARKMSRRPGAQKPVGELPVWSLGVIGRLSREEIHGDYDYRF